MSTTHDQRIRLALFIIERHFGEITRDVAATLLTTEHATLQQVVRKCGGTGTVPTPPKTLSPADVRAALLVLLHHNCLTVHLPPQVSFFCLVFYQKLMFCFHAFFVSENNMFCSF
jgi:hypothetical protein